MSEFTPDELISAILNWAAEKNPKFDTSFVDSVAEGYEEFNEFTEAQEAALMKIISGFKIDVDFWAD